VILMNPADLARMGFAENQLVAASSPAGRAERVLARPYDIAQGCALMYYPEANALVPRASDPRSKTPAYKAVVVTLEPSRFASTSEEGALLTVQTKSPKNERKNMKAC
jgi:anaerobic selenocysteine-containing dehydrogenase